MSKRFVFRIQASALPADRSGSGGGYPTGEGFSLSAQYLNISGLAIYGLEDPIYARLADDYGNNVSDGTIVSFKTYNTGGYMNPPSVSTSSGVADAKLVSAGPEPENGIVTVTAETANGALSTRITSLAAVRESQLNRIIYAGTNGGGVYKSSNSGQTWTNISRSSTIAGENRIDPYINDIKVDPFNSNIIYAATGYQGGGNIFRSRDGGQTWTDNDPKSWKGLFPIPAAVLTLECDDTSDGTSASRIWIGTAGSGIYTLDSQGSVVYSDSSTFTYVNDIVKAKGLNILYAGTATGVYKSINGGQNWTASDTAANHYVTSLAIHPRSSGNIVYAGTRDKGVWVSVDAGKSWTQSVEGFGKGVFATYPQIKVLTGTELADGTMGEVKVLSGAKSESWTVAYAGTSFKVTGSISGEQTQRCSVGSKCTVGNLFEFTITAGSIAFKDGDTFTFDTFNDDGRYIRNLLVDSGNNRLYALTYYKPDIAPHATGQVYVHDLSSNGEMAYTDWREITTGLSRYDSASTSDTSLFANHTLASDDPDGESPTMLYLGGEGINFYRASLSSGQVTVWQQSNTGLSNLIMARMPILFSGLTTLCAIDGYLMATDINGNPPIIASKIVVTPPSGSTQPVITYTYADSPYNRTYGPVVTGSTIVFTPACASSSVAPGCSGSPITCIAGTSCGVCQ
ncbi:MAG: hypothetical protein HC887_01795 [Desulfobacteraceae bacterium]|nr:hypothetical protein [Desulfobacteraceae bacterium]